MCGKASCTQLSEWMSDKDFKVTSSFFLYDVFLITKLETCCFSLNMCTCQIHLYMQTSFMSLCIKIILNNLLSTDTNMSQSSSYKMHQHYLRLQQNTLSIPGHSVKLQSQTKTELSLSFCNLKLSRIKRCKMELDFL